MQQVYVDVKTPPSHRQSLASIYAISFQFSLALRPKPALPTIMKGSNRVRLPTGPVRGKASVNGQMVAEGGEDVTEMTLLRWRAASRLSFRAGFKV
ncbi:hypothetical protein BaRGS_00032431 [Batillaria attramentaria]|uniref:Uncharacterized protein n=1 Tax=Batillaria attramentaria TaxID=370345 RepID=A0ABD0JNF0_9CAEN